MEQITKPAFDKSAFNPILFKGYKVAKKLVKYAFYLALLYLVCEAFMDWK